MSEASNYWFSLRKKTTREIIETKAGLRTVQHVTKTRKDSGETLPSKTLRNKTSGVVVIDYLNVSRKTVQLVFIFNSESKNISTCTVQRELWGLGLN